MPLPSTVRVKLSSEAAEAISITPVVVQEMAVRELLEQILAVTGKDEARIAQLLLHGTLVAGASRFRWQGWQADAAALRELLAGFPDPDPSRPFAPACCLRARLRGGRQAIDLPRDAASRKGFFQRATFWDALMQMIPTGPVDYAGYSYRDRCDRYLRELSPADVARIRAAAGTVQYSTLRDRILTLGFTSAELFVTR